MLRKSVLVLSASTCLIALVASTAAAQVEEPDVLVPPDAPDAGTAVGDAVDDSPLGETVRDSPLGDVVPPGSEPATDDAASTTPTPEPTGTGVEDADASTSAPSRGGFTPRLAFLGLAAVAVIGGVGFYVTRGKGFPFLGRKP